MEPEILSQTSLRGIISLPENHCLLYFVLVLYVFVFGETNSVHIYLPWVEEGHLSFYPKALGGIYYWLNYMC